MGREIRMVPPNWKHPITENASDWYDHDTRKHYPVYSPMFAKNYDKAVAEYEEDRKAYNPEEHSNCSFEEWYGEPPMKEYYAPYTESEATWYQMYETVSEGTPLTPPFATKQELIDYLVNVGADWDGKMSRERAEAFVKAEWTPSMVVDNGKVMTGIEALPTE